MALLVDVINFFDLNFIIPISLADQNMERAHIRDGVLGQKFWFNKNFVQSETYWVSKLHESDFLKSGEQTREPEYEEFTVLEVLIGKKGTDFEGIRPVIWKFMEVKEFSEEHTAYINYMIDFLVARATGTVPTGARFIRDLISSFE